MTYVIEGHCYQTNERYQEAYPTKMEMIEGLKIWFKRDDINISEEEFQKVINEGYFADGYDIIELKREPRPISYETKLLQEKMKDMCEVAAEEDFYRIKDLFNQAIDVPKIVQTFQEIYDLDFQFEGTPHQLYIAIQQWLTKNTG